MDSPHYPKLTDGIIFLRLLTAEDAAAHLAGEDDEMAKWVSGGRSTLTSVQAFIEGTRQNWINGGPRRALGITDCATGQLIGFIEMSKLPVLQPGQINISFGIFNAWRGRGLAGRAINLVGKYLHATSGEKQMILRVQLGNSFSIRVAEKAGFSHIGIFDEAEGRLHRYVRDISG